MNIKLTLFFYLFCSNSIFTGFAVNTPVRTHDGPIYIQDVKIDTSIYYNIPTKDDGRQVGSCKVYNAMRYVDNDYILLIIGDSELVRCAKKQQFFTFEKMDWVDAQDLKIGDNLVADKNRKVPVLYIERCDDGIELFDLGTDHDRYCATSEEVLVHNMPQFFWKCVNFFSSKLPSSKFSFNLNFFGFWLNMGYKGEDVDEEIDKKYNEFDHCCKYCKNPYVSKYQYQSRYFDLMNGVNDKLPKNGSRALNNSIKIDTGNSERRIGLDNGQIVLFDENGLPGEFFGTVMKWSELDKSAKRALVILNRIVDMCRKKQAIN